jgi:hypothetical protein
LIGAGLQDLAEDDVLDRFGFESGTLQHLCHGESAQLHRLQIGERPSELADGRPGARHDHGAFAICHLS